MAVNQPCGGYRTALIYGNSGIDRKEYFFQNFSERRFAL